MHVRATATLLLCSHLFAFSLLVVTVNAIIYRLSADYYKGVLLSRFYSRNPCTTVVPAFFKLCAQQLLNLTRHTYISL